MQGSALSTALIFAAAAGRAERCAAFLAAGADENTANGYGNTPLIMAAQSGDLPTLECILARRPALDWQNEGGNTALLYAAYQGRFEIARQLTLAGAGVNVCNRHGNTPLIYAAYNGHVAVVELLLGAGASIDAADEERRTALIWSAIRNKPEVSALLIAAGANPDLADVTGMTAADWTHLMWLPTALRESDRRHSVTVRRLAGEEVSAAQPYLAALLQDAVHNGASVGYLAPLGHPEAMAYWAGIAADVQRGRRILLVAEGDGELVGTVNLLLEERPNGNHRAEVSKLLVHSAFRRRGIARALMQSLEEHAKDADRSLLILDTRTGDHAEWLYRSLGYVTIGVVPRAARDPDGRLASTTFMYKLLDGRA